MFACGDNNKMCTDWIWICKIHLLFIICLLNLYIYLFTCIYHIFHCKFRKTKNVRKSLCCRKVSLTLFFKAFRGRRPPQCEQTQPQFTEFCKVFMIISRRFSNLFFDHEWSAYQIMDDSVFFVILVHTCDLRVFCSCESS